MGVFGDFVYLVIDKFTDRVAAWIKFKELEKRVKVDD